MIPLGILAGARVAAAAGFAYKGTATEASNVSGTTRTIAAVPIGAAAANRVVIVAVSGKIGSGSNISSVTIGGVSATIDAQPASGFKNAAWIARAVVPTGTTADVVATISTAEQGYAKVASYVAYGTVTKHAGAGQYLASGTGPSVTVSCPAGGYLIAALSNNDYTTPSSMAFTAGGVTEDVNITATQTTIPAAAMAHKAALTAGNLTVTGTITGSGGKYAGIVAATYILT